MIGLVFVSHSRALALALRDLVLQVTSGGAQIAIAAGTGPDKSEFGTDAIEISEAIQSVFTTDGVLVLMDLGSAVLSAQVAVELLPPDMAEKVLFCSAPLVEGAIAAAVQASLGSNLEVTCSEAQLALLPKKEQLGESVEATAQTEKTAHLPQAEVEQAEYTLRNTYGLHARPAARFVQQAAKFDAQIQVRNLTNQKGPVSAKSLNALATLGAVQNHTIEILAHGPQASEALAALGAMIADNFGESTEPPPAITTGVPRTAVTAENGALGAIPIAEGFALAPLERFTTPPPPIPQESAENPAQAWDDLQQARARAHQEIAAQRRSVAASAGEEQAGIFDAHLLILDDPEILQAARQAIFEQGQNPAAAWHSAILQAAGQYEALDDPYLKQRAADVRDVGNHVLFALAGAPAVAEQQFDEPIILLAEDLTPTQTAGLDLDKIQGIATVLGGPTSHSAILARSLGIPAISGIPESILRMPRGTLGGLDGSQGILWVDPGPEVRSQLIAQRADWLARRAALLQQSSQQGSTRDGHRVEVAANVGNLADAQAGVRNGAEGIGLLRTEFLFLTRTTPPTETEQHEALQAIAEVMAGAPVIVRTLDVGGDKPLPYINLPLEANPFLGVRAIRLSLQRPDLFTTQLRAVLRAGSAGPLRIMFPMISGVEEILAARQILEKCHLALEEEQIPHQWPIETGIMIEVPSAAVLASQLAPAVDFFSIGTNDLTQYTLAAERGNASLAGYADGLHPAVLHLIHQVAQGAEANGKWAGICGELGGDPAAVPILVGLGISELSMNAGSIPRVKALLRTFTLSEAQNIAHRALFCTSASEVRAMANEFLAALPAA
jgi:multiphosphoryl transfer protein